jgi:hypothetical protein
MANMANFRAIKDATKHGSCNSFDASTETGSSFSDTDKSDSLGSFCNEPPLPKTQLGSMLTKTTFCKHFRRGYCRFGDKCSYAHESAELMRKPNLTKTRMCTHFMNGRCRHDNCKFAHGAAEMQTEMEQTKPQDAFVPVPKFVQPRDMQATYNPPVVWEAVPMNRAASAQPFVEQDGSREYARKVIPSFTLNDKQAGRSQRHQDFPLTASRSPMDWPRQLTTEERCEFVAPEIHRLFINEMQQQLLSAEMEKKFSMPAAPPGLVKPNMGLAQKDLHSAAWEASLVGGGIRLSL